MVVDVVVVVVVVVVVDGDGNGDVEVDAQWRNAAKLWSMRTTCSAFNVSTSINEPSSSSPWSTTLSTLFREAMPIVQTNYREPPSPLSETSPKARGAGPRPTANRYKIARGAAMESAASLDVMKLRKVITEARYERGCQRLEAVVAMLSKMS